MDDTISRRAAIDALCDNCETINSSCAHFPCKRYLAIIDLPSAQPEQKKGKWIDMGDFEQCSVCMGTRLKEVNTVYGITIWIKSAYCPSCGADLRGNYDG